MASKMNPDQRLCGGHPMTYPVFTGTNYHKEVAS